MECSYDGTQWLFRTNCPMSHVCPVCYRTKGANTNKQAVGKPWWEGEVMDVSRFQMAGDPVGNRPHSPWCCILPYQLQWGESAHIHTLTHRLIPTHTHIACMKQQRGLTVKGMNNILKSKRLSHNLGRDSNREACGLDCNLKF